MPRMRTLNAAVEYFKSQDPNTAITKHFLYTEARAGRLPGVVMAGKKRLFDLDRLEKYLSEGLHLNPQVENSDALYGKLRKVF